jgi:hypothetical protein
MPEQEPTQRTKQGFEIPVPKRDQVLRDFAKATEPDPPKPKRSRRRKRSTGK